MRKLVAFAMSILAVGSLRGQTFTVDNLTYTVDADIPGAVILTGTTAVSESVTIPSTVTYGEVAYAVKSIAPGAFKKSKIAGNIVIPESVRVIGKGAFEYCEGITGIVLPATVDSIGDDCFSNCTSVKELYLGAAFCYGRPLRGRPIAATKAFYSLGKNAGELTLTIGKEVERVEYSLFNTGYVTSLIFEPEGRCRTIDVNAFRETPLTGTLNLPETIDSIGEYAFSNTQLVELTVPAGVDTIGQCAFNSIVTLGKVNWNAADPKCELPVFANNRTNRMTFDLVLGDDVRNVPDGLFEYFDKEGVMASGLKSITWPTNCRIERIGTSAFANNTLLTGDMTIPSSVKIVGSEAFAGCSGLMSATLPHTIEQLGADVFVNCKALERLVYDVPDGASILGDYSSDASEVFPAEIVIGPHVETIPTGFMGYTTVPYKVIIAGATSLRNIEKEAFDGLSNITFDSLMFPHTLETIGRRAFYYCRSIKADVRFPASLKGLDYDTFEGVTATSLYLGSDSVKNLGGLNFAGPLVIEKTLRHVEKGLFERSAITSLTIEEGSMLDSIGDRAFADTKFTGELTWPQGLVSVGASAFKNCDQFTLTGDLPETLERVGAEAFYGCVGLNGPFTLPAALESVGAEAFYGCTGLNGTLTLPASLKSVGWNAFAGTSFTKLVIEKCADPLQFGDNFNPTGSWIIKAPGRNFVDVMSGLELPTGQFSAIEEAVIDRDITYRGGLVMDMGIARHYYSPFNGATALSRVKLGSGVTTILPYFLTSGCIAEIEVESLMPPVAKEKSFDGCDYEKCVLRVPTGGVDGYAAADGWKNFIHITDPQSAITEIKADAPDATYFDIRGISVPRPTGRGIYIRRSPSGSSKLKL